MSDVLEHFPGIPEQDPIDPATFATSASVFQYALDAALHPNDERVLRQLETPDAIHLAAAGALINGTLGEQAAAALRPDDRRYYDNVAQRLASLTRRRFFAVNTGTVAEPAELLSNAADEFYGRQRQLRQFDRIRALTEASSGPDDLVKVAEAYGAIRYLARDVTSIGGKVMQPNVLTRLMLNTTEDRLQIYATAEPRDIAKEVEPAVQSLLDNTTLQSAFAHEGPGRVDEFALSGLLKTKQGTAAYRAGLLLVIKFAQAGNAFAADLGRQLARGRR